MFITERIKINADIRQAKALIKNLSPSETATSQAAQNALTHTKQAIAKLDAYYAKHRFLGRLVKWIDQTFGAYKTLLYFQTSLPETSCREPSSSVAKNPSTIAPASFSNPQKITKEEARAFLNETMQNMSTNLAPPSRNNLTYFSNWIIKLYTEKKAVALPSTFMTEHLLFNRHFESEKAIHIEKPHPIKYETEFSYLDPRNKEEMQLLTNTLRAAFALGKEIVTTRLRVTYGDTSYHTVAAAFTKDGKCTIVDSYFDDKIGIKNFTAGLNAASILNENGSPIHFEGEYINTHIQSKFFGCQQYAMLYCYQMFKDGRIDSFAKVNGAFAAGMLRTLNDIEKISHAQPLRVLSGYDEEKNTDPLFICWILNACGFRHNTWKEIKMDEISLGDWIMEITLQKNCRFPTVIGTGSENNLQRKEIALPQGSESLTLGSLASQSEDRVLVLQKGRAPKLYRI